MAREKRRVALIGSGMIATAGHIPAWKNLKDDVEIVAVADLLKERAELIARTEGIPHAFGDWEKMLSEQKPDIVSVTTPNAYHCEQTIAALQAGAHVLCEKPIATSHADAKRMFDAAKAAGRILFVCQSLRFYNAVLAAKEIADAGRLGEIYFAEGIGLRRRGIPKWGQFHMKVHSGGGPVYDLGVHLLDRMMWIMGFPQVKSVSGTTFTKLGNRDEGQLTSLEDSGAPLGVLTPRKYDWREFDVEDMAAGMVRLANNAIILFKTSWAANIPKSVWTSSFLGTEGGLQLDPLALVGNMGRYPVDTTPHVPSDRPVVFSGHWLAAEHFIRVLRGDEELIVKPDQVLTIMRILDAIYASAESGKEIVLG